MNKLYCKKTIYPTPIERERFIYRVYENDEVFTEGKFYELDKDMVNNKNIIPIRDNSDFYYGFHRTNTEQKHYIWNWFYTEQELRKKKLEKIESR